jgi:Tfp pilus assembly protein PilX
MKQIKNSKVISRGDFHSLPVRQEGAILLIAVVVLVAMTLSALALIKSVNTTNLIAGNLGFRESALLSSERSTERAVRYLEKDIETLHDDDLPNCYKATRDDPSGKRTWENVINDVVEDSRAKCGSRDAAGNNVWYVIHRLCKEKGSPDSAKCSISPTGVEGGSLKTGEKGTTDSIDQYYYRVTTRVNGPRNTTVYTQTILAK